MGVLVTQTEIYNLYIHVLVEEEVLQLQVSVHYQILEEKKKFYYS